MKPATEWVSGPPPKRGAYRTRSDGPSANPGWRYWDGRRWGCLSSRRDWCLEVKGDRRKTPTTYPILWARTVKAAPVHVPTGIEAEVCAEIARRQALGIAKYGQTVAENPLSLRQWLQHALEEALDLAVYLKRAIAELDARAKP